MKSNPKNTAVGFAVGLALGAVVLTSFGQDSTKTTKPTADKKSPSARRNFTVPRYSVQYDSAQKLLLITDNAYSQLFLYDTGSSGGSILRSRIDLRQTGARQLRGVTARSSTAPPKSKGSKPKSSQKPKEKPKGKPKGKKTK